MDRETRALIERERQRYEAGGWTMHGSVMTTLGRVERWMEGCRRRGGKVEVYGGRIDERRLVCVGSGTGEQADRQGQEQASSSETERADR